MNSKSSCTIAEDLPSLKILIMATWLAYSKDVWKDMDMILKPLISFGIKTDWQWKKKLLRDKCWTLSTKNHRKKKKTDIQITKRKFQNDYKEYNSINKNII